MSRFVNRAGAVLALCAALGAVWIFWHTRDRHRGYAVDLRIRPGAAARGDALRVGFGRRDDHSGPVTHGLARRVCQRPTGNGRARRPVGGGNRGRRWGAPPRLGRPRRHRPLSRRRRRDQAPRRRIDGAGLPGRGVHAQPFDAGPDGPLGPPRGIQRCRRWIPTQGHRVRRQGRCRSGRRPGPGTGVAARNSASDRRSRCRQPGPAGVRRHAPHDVFHSPRRLHHWQLDQLGQSPRDAVGGQHRDHRRFPWLPAQ